MKARMVENLMDVIDEYFEGKEGHRANKDFIKLCKRISGKEVELVLFRGDVFEINDNNFCLPECCWVAM